MSFAERFMESKGAPVQYKGRFVHAIYELKGLTAESALRLEFLDVSPYTEQCLRMTSRQGAMEVNGAKDSGFDLWSDTSPAEVSVKLYPAGTVMSVKVWNAWRDVLGVTQAWIGNAGMLVSEESPTTVTLKCSDGFDEPTFDDLVVRISMATLVR